MSLKVVFERFEKSLEQLQEAVSALHLTVYEDKPKDREVVLMERLDNSVTDLMGAIEGASAYAKLATQGIPRGGGLDETRAAIKQAHECLNRAGQIWLSELTGHRKLEPVAQLARERGTREWQGWLATLKVAIDRVSQPWMAVQNGLLEAWHELTERLARASVSVQATNIGQQITLREDELALAGKTS